MYRYDPDMVLLKQTGFSGIFWDLSRCTTKPTATREAMPHYQNITRLIFLTISIVLYLLAIFAKQEYPSEVNGWGFITGAIAILALLPWHKINKDALSFTTKPEWLAVGVVFSLVTIWLWIY